MSENIYWPRRAWQRRKKNPCRGRHLHSTNPSSLNEMSWKFHFLMIFGRAINMSSAKLWARNRRTGITPSIELKPLCSTSHWSLELSKKALRVICRATCCGENTTVSGLLWVGMRQSFISQPYDAFIFKRKLSESLKHFSSSENTTAPELLWVGMKRSLILSIYEPRLSHRKSATSPPYDLEPSVDCQASHWRETS